MSQNSALQEYDYHVEIAQAIRETRQMVEEAMGFIERQEDGPVTMRHALKDIEDRVDGIETEVACMAGTVDRLNVIIMRLIEQRDQAVHQRDLVMLGQTGI